MVSQKSILCKFPVGTAFHELAWYSSLTVKGIYWTLNSHFRREEITNKNEEMYDVRSVLQLTCYVTWAKSISFCLVFSICLTICHLPTLQRCQSNKTFTIHCIKDLEEKLYPEFNTLNKLYPKTCLFLGSLWLTKVVIFH